MGSPKSSAPGAADKAEFKAIVSDLWQNSERLVQQELQLALAELDVRVDRAKVTLRRGAIAGGLFHAAYLTTLATLVLLLAEVVAPWLAALLVAVPAAAGAYLFARGSQSAAQQTVEPTNRSTHSVIPPMRKESSHVSAE